MENHTKKIKQRVAKAKVAKAKMAYLENRDSQVDVS